jgi:hypothetical protein
LVRLAWRKHRPRHAPPLLHGRSHKELYEMTNLGLQARINRNFSYKTISGHPLTPLFGLPGQIFLLIQENNKKTH